MSFSFSVSDRDIAGTTLAIAVDDKVQNLPDGIGKQEAQALVADIPRVIKSLTAHSELDYASVSGYASPSTANLSVTVVLRVSARPPETTETA